MHCARSRMLWSLAGRMLLGLSVTVLASILWLRRQRSKSRFPPGPPQWPIVGSLLHIRHLSHLPRYQVYCKLAYQYGDVYSLALGSRCFVFLTKYETIRKALVDLPIAFAGRAPRLFHSTLQGNPRELGIASHTYTPEWKAQRSAVMTILRSLGFGQSTTEQKIQEECRAAIEEFTNHGCEAFRPHDIIHHSVTNVVCYLLFGERYNHQDEEFQQLLVDLGMFLEMTFSNPFVEFMPVTRLLPSSWDHCKRYKAICKKIGEFIAAKIADRKDNLDATLGAQDFIQAYLLELQSATSKITENWAQQIVLDFFVAGSDTTSTTLSWALLYMIKYPAIQKKVQAEIDSVLDDPNAAVSLAHRASMPYTEAVLMEVQRHCCVAPYGVPHMTTRDVEFCGYLIPKDTTISINLWGPSRDETIWEEPESFNPDRFLTEDGHVHKPKEWIPFSLGRRMCVGEQLARQELFLFLTSILKTFTLQATVDPAQLDLSPYKSSAILKPCPYTLTVTKRQ